MKELMNASEALVYKSETLMQTTSLHYVMALFLLLLLVWCWIKKYKQKNSHISSIQIIDKKQLSPKMFMYVIHYHNKPFLLVDNQHAIAFHSLEEGIHEKN